MAENIVINGVTYPAVKSVALMTADGRVVVFGSVQTVNGIAPDENGNVNIASAYDTAKSGGYAGTETEFASDLAAIPEKVDKSYIISVFEDLKLALADADINGAIAVLDQAILDMATLA